MTLEQAKKQYYQVIYHIRLLQRALDKAYNSKLIQYENFREESPCDSLYEVEKRFEKTTKDAIAKAFDAEINKEFWKKSEAKSRTQSRINKERKR